MADRNDTINTKADKGGAAVIIEVEDYDKEAERQLHNKVACKRLQHGPTQTHTTLVSDTITCFKNDELITENIGKGFGVNQFETPKFCTWLKIFKNRKPWTPSIKFRKLPY